MTPDATARAVTTQSARGAGASIVVPDDVMRLAEDTMGAFFEPISKTDRVTAARDFLDLTKSYKRAALLERHAQLKGARLLEIGCGFGTNLAVWLSLGADAQGVEPGGPGFGEGPGAARQLLAANGMDPGRVMEARGEELPFANGTFDIVYSANVLEHTADPQRVVDEALRVLRPGGVLHMEMPNFLSYFEGHYLVIAPPVVANVVLRWWIGFVVRRDPSYVATLRTQINPLWCRRALAGRPARLVSMGEEIFLDRLTQPFAFETEAVAGRLGTVLRVFRAINVGNWLGHLVVLLQGHYPIYLTAVKTSHPA